MFCAFIIIKMVFGRAYSSCLYLLFLSWYKKRRQKKIKASTEAGETGRIHDGNKKRDAFSVFIIIKLVFGGAYAIRPYPDGRKIVAPQPYYLVGSAKRAAFGTCYLVGSEKRAAFRTCYLVGSEKRAAFGTCYLVGSTKRAAFGTSILVGGAKRAAFGTSI